MHAYIHTCMHACMHTYIHTHTHTHIHMYIPTYLHTYKHTYIRAHIHTYIHTHCDFHSCKSMELQGSTSRCLREPQCLSQASRLGSLGKGWLEGNCLGAIGLHTVFFVPGAHLDVAVLQDWHSLDHQRGAAAAKRRCELEVSGVDSGVNRIAIRVSPTVSISNIYVPIIEFPAIYIGSGAPALSAKEVPAIY